MRQLLKHTFLFINLLVIGWLGLCFAASVVNPIQVRFIAIFSLTTPFAILANFLFAVLWLFTSTKWRSLLSVVSLLLCYKMVSAVFAFHYFDHQDFAKTGNTVKVMSWNAHGLGVFQVPYTKEPAQRMIEYIQKEDPDILCMPEYYTRYDNALKPHSTDIIEAVGFREFRFNMDNTIGDKIHLGTAIFSKYPFENYQVYVLSKYIYMLQCDMRLANNKMMRMFFIHLHSFGLSDHDRQYIEEGKTTKSPLGSGLKRSGFFIWKFSDAYAKRAKEAQLAEEIVSKSPYPVMICGDLNDLPASYTYSYMKKNLKDAFVEKGHGIGRTYNQIFPTLRIDYIFYNPSFLKIIGYKCPKTKLSDHNPVIANFDLTE